LPLTLLLKVAPLPVSGHFKMLLLVIKLLLEEGAELDFEDQFGRTPLSTAVESGCEAVGEAAASEGR